ncbi:threonine transporter [Burkholderia cenocepacia]|nr:threonine transporter [Burkholderia cenocepacia]
MRAVEQDRATRGDGSRHALFALACRNTMASGPMVTLG